jgi:cAMP-dependent protein kinase regulator
MADKNNAFMHGHQEYIQKKVNPVLEAMVTQVLLERPADLVPFMIQWLGDQSCLPVQGQVSAQDQQEYDQLKTELDFWKGKLKELEEVVQKEKSKPTEGEADEEADPEADEDEEDDEDVVDDMPSPEEVLKAKKGPRTSVSAEAYGVFNKMDTEYKAPVYEKSDDQILRIQKVLEACFLFQALDKKELTVVIDAMKELKITHSQTLITEGEDGNELFVIEKGRAECFKTIEGEEKMVKVCEPGDAFGELALMYNAPRAATVKTVGEGTLWTLDRQTFTNIVLQAMRSKRERWIAFIGSITLFERMDSHEKDKLCDALRIEKHAVGSHIIKQGDPGEKFYILESGECVAMKVFSPGTEAKEVLHYKRGDYFGELAVLHNEPRAASIIAKTEVEVLCLDRKGFKTLLGPLEDIIRRNTTRYE